MFVAELKKTRRWGGHRVHASSHARDSTTQRGTDVPYPVIVNKGENCESPLSFPSIGPKEL